MFMIKNLNRFIIFAVLCILFSFSGYAATPKYKLIDLGLQESDRSEAVAVNDSGEVVGSYWMFGKKHYFKWLENEGISLIGLPETAEIRVLNNAGQIAGNYKDASGKDRGFIWDASFGFKDIGTLGGSFARVHDMNDLGQIVGESESSNISLVDGRKEQHAFLWQNNSMLDLGALSGDLGFLGDRSVATSINNHGQIIGTSNHLIAHKVKLLRANNRAVAWIDGVIKEVGGALEPQCSAWAFSINNNGLATYYQNNEMGWFVVDLFTMNTSKIQDMSRWAFKLNDNGDVFLFHNHNYNLDKEIADITYFKKNESNYEDFRHYEHVYFGNSYDNLQPWKPGSFEGACDFNNKRWVVGIAENRYGERHGVLLIPINNP